MAENKNTVHRIIVALVALVGLAVSIVSFIWRLNNFVSIRSFILVAVYYGFVFYYGVYGYKKPHGNMVRYLFLILAFYISISIIIMVERWDISWVILLTSNFSSILIAYMAGRLNKFKKNIFLSILIFLLLIMKSFWPVEGAHFNAYPLFVLDRTMPIFMFITVLLIYFFRYKEHKIAGIEEDAEEEDAEEEELEEVSEQ